MIVLGVLQELFSGLAMGLLAFQTTILNTLNTAKGLQLLANDYFSVAQVLRSKC